MTDATPKAALLVMDVQTAVLDLIPVDPGYLARVSAAIDAAHGNKTLVIQVVVGFRPGAPEAVGIFKQLSAILINPEPAIAATGDDVVVTKRRVSAFSGSDLEVILRTQGIRHLVLGGIATSGVVLSTVREAFDKDFQITVLSDLCHDADAEVHATLMGKVFPRQASVITSAEWMGGARTP